VAGAVACALGAIGCTALSDLSALQCRPYDDCGATSEAPNWACAGRVTYVEPSGGEARLGLTITDYFTGAPVADVGVAACRKADLGCDEPLVPAVNTDDQGLVDLALPTYDASLEAVGFPGYLAIASPGYVPSLFFLNPPLLADRQEDLPILPSTAFDALLMALREPSDADSGAVSAVAYDCGGAPAAGVRFVLDGGELAPYYFLDGAPTLRADKTDPTGVGGFFHVPPGLRVVHARSPGSGREVAVVNVIVRAGFLTYVDLHPTPL
jgi:hypothetical protein